MKEESNARFKILMECILMKQRFEEQEHVWKMWIDLCRQQIAKFLNYCNLFFDDVNSNYGGLKKTRNFDKEEVEKSIANLLEQTTTAYFVIRNNFENLKRIEESCPDALFVRVLQKCLADVAKKFIKIHDSLRKMKLEKLEFQRLQNKIEELSPNIIFTTKQLREICKDPYSVRKYRNIEFPLIEEHR